MNIIIKDNKSYLVVGIVDSEGIIEKTLPQLKKKYQADLILSTHKQSINKFQQNLTELLFVQEIPDAQIIEQTGSV